MTRYKRTSIHSKKFLALWDAHSTADYEDQMEDVDIDVRSSKVYCAVAKDLLA